MRWTKGEEQVLARSWAVHGAGWPGWRAALPGRTMEAIRSKARAMGLQREGWTKDQHVALITGMRDVVRATGHDGAECAEEFLALLRRYGWI